MFRRDFLKAGVAGAALSMDENAPTIDASASDDELARNMVVISVDGSTLSSEMVDKYKHNGADVWLYDGPRTIPRFSRAFEFLDRESARITLCRSYKEILAAKRAGKVAMVFGWQDSEALEEEYGNDWRDHKPPLSNLRAWYELGLRVACLQYNMANQFGGGCLDPTVPLTIQGKIALPRCRILASSSIAAAISERRQASASST
jgi:membrane dipeptidase